MVQSYAGDSFQAFGLDLWNGSQIQASAFVNTTEMTFPLLRSAGTAGLGGSYDTGKDMSFVLDGDGVIRHRGAGFNETQVRAAIDDGLAQLVTAVGPPQRPEPFRLHPARPNPFNPRTTIAWTIDPGASDVSVRVEIHDLRGRRLATLVDGRRAPGEHQVVWDGRADNGSPAVSGTYVAVLDVDGAQQARFLTMIK